ncbi:MAG: ABC transporter ATP-binding protein [Firmicutes bacterium]|nr:ABC transporter ATP-binding protein [Bacillota bacterium]
MIINAQNIIKNYKNKAVLNGINFKVNEGEIHAILGKNGAGKSTFIKVSLGLIFPTSGEIAVYGEKPGHKNTKIGYLSENITLYPHLTAKENLKVAAYTADEKISDSRISDILERMSLNNLGNKKSIEFSLGMKRRLQLAMATMIKEVDFLILDEPTNGLDINGLIWLKSYLKELNKKGVSILLASHSILDLQESITNYSIFENGIIAKEGKWINDQSQGFEIKVDKNDEIRLVNILKHIPKQIVNYDKAKIILNTEMNFKEINQLLFKENIIPENITIIKNSLEKVYLETIGEL